MVGSHPAAIRAAPLADGSAEPPAEGIRKDTNGPDQASDADQHGAHLPGRILVLTDLDVPAPGLGHGPHLLSGSPSSPARTLSVRGEGAEEGPTSMPRGLLSRPQTPPEERDGCAGSWAVVRAVRPDGARREMPSMAGQAPRLAPHRKMRTAEQGRAQGVGRRRPRRPPQAVAGEPGTREQLLTCLRNGACPAGPSRQRRSHDLRCLS